MRRWWVLVVVLAASGGGWFVPGEAVPPPARTVAVAGTGVTMYPAFDRTVERYAATTTAATGGSLSVTATTADPSGVVLVDGHPTTSATTVVPGLAAGDEVSVIIDDAGGRTAYSVMYLPAGFPALTATVDLPAQEQPGLVALTPNAFNFAVDQPSFNAIVDRHGVPVYAVASGMADYDLKQQPDGEITVFRPTTTPGHTGADLVTLDDQLADSTRRAVAAPLINTDTHDSVRLPDGSTILIGYEPNAGTGRIDATIQKLDPSGTPTFTWNSGDDPTIAARTTAGSNPDYAHINSVVSVGNGDVIASFRHLSSVYRIATVAHDGYAPGEVIWKLGGRDSSFTFPNDPLGGPCAQHSASELADGHVLVFDNGTSAAFGAPDLCVDPADPLGPTIPRGFTRVAEYALDTTAGTATLVWSYPSDTSRYAFFAGSARRLANGNTLIGWAADWHALATEVDPAGQKVWELTAPDPAVGLQKYTTYRAALIPDVPDRIAPTVTTGTVDDAVYLLGDAVAPPYRCADRGGSDLQTCEVTGLTGGRLDTGTTGARTWQVRATDGNGNVTTVTRHYSVRPPGRRPDGLIRKRGTPWWKGGDVYGPATDQTVRQHARRRHVVTAYWQVQNDGDRTDRFRLTGTASSARFTVRYLAGGADVTRAVVSGSYRTPALAPGREVTLTVRVTPTRRARVHGHRTFTLRAVSAADGAAVDRVATTVTARR